MVATYKFLLKRNPGLGLLKAYKVILLGWYDQNLLINIIRGVYVLTELYDIKCIGIKF